MILLSISYNHLYLLWTKSYFIILFIILIRGDIIKYLFRLFYNIIELLLVLLFITILYYFNIIGDGLYSTLKLIVLLGSIFINSFILSSNYKDKRYLIGIKYSLIIIVLFFIPSLLLSKLDYRLIIYYLLIIITSIFGSIINKKEVT